MGQYICNNTKTHNSSTSTSTENPSPVNDKNEILIGVLIGIIGVIFLSIIGFLGHKRIKKRIQGEILNISALQKPMVC